MKCIWCESEHVHEAYKNCAWVLPDGRRAVEILQIPAISCEHCGLYLTDEMNQKIEDQLYMSDLSQYPDRFTYEELLQAPRINLFSLNG